MHNSRAQSVRDLKNHRLKWVADSPVLARRNTENGFYHDPYALFGVGSLWFQHESLKQLAHAETDGYCKPHIIFYPTKAANKGAIVKIPGRRIGLMVFRKERRNPQAAESAELHRD
jgi:hypothetical protein